MRLVFEGVFVDRETIFSNFYFVNNCAYTENLFDIY